MDIVIRLDHTGEPGVLRPEERIPAAPGPGEVRVEQAAIGVNYLDIMQRKGAAPLALPNGLGLEAAGRVMELGAGVEDLAPGDRVAYILGPVGAYASARRIPAERMVKIPDALSCTDAAAILFKGITAEYLLTSTGRVRSGDTILLYGAAGGVGRIMAAMARAAGTTVVGVVSRASAAPLAEAAGCHHVLVWGACDLPTEVARLTGGRKAQVVYDGVGRDTFAASLDCLAPRGLLASIGASSGPPPAVEMATLNAKGSLFVTRPSIVAYATDPTEYRARAQAVFSAAEAGIIQPCVWRSYPLTQAAEAHAAIEAGGVEGAVLLQP